MNPTRIPYYMTNLNPIIPVPQNSQTSPIIIHQDNSAFPTSIILDENNYPLWSQLMEMRIGARNKTEYLTRAANQKIPCLQHGSPKVKR
jgi:hypothetical protein